MRTALCDKLGIDVPIVLAALGGAHSPELAAAVSNAGGLGMLPLWGVDIDTLRRDIRATQALTSRPFAVNLNVGFPQEERLAVCLEEGVKVISFFWADPSKLVPVVKAAGATVLHTVANAADARRAVDCGVDIIVAQGWEAGGHVRGTVATMALVPAVVDAVGDVPVVAAGGIADGRGLAAALALGAAGAWIGTRFLASEEVRIHPEYQRRLLVATENDTAWSEDLFQIGWPDAPHRVLRPTACCATARYAPGKRRAARRLGRGRGRATSSPPRQPAVIWYVTAPSPFPPRSAAMSRRCACGPARASGWCARCSRRRRSWARSWPMRGPS